MATWRSDKKLEPKMTGAEVKKTITARMDCLEKRRLEIGPRCTGTRNRDPGSRRDQEFWCRETDGESLRHRQAWKSRIPDGDNDVDGGGKHKRQGGDGSGRGTCNGRAWRTGNG